MGFTGVQGGSEVLSECVLLIWAQLCQGLQCLSPEGVVKPSPGEQGWQSLPWAQVGMLTVHVENDFFSPDVNCQERDCTFLDQLTCLLIYQYGIVLPPFSVVCNKHCFLGAGFLHQRTWPTDPASLYMCPSVICSFFIPLPPQLGQSLEPCKDMALCFVFVFGQVMGQYS